MSTPINSSWFDVLIQLTGLTLCGFLLFVLEYSRMAYRLVTLRLFLAYSLVVTIILSIMLLVSAPMEYAHVYWITQSFSYLIEVSICIQLAKEAIVDNWYVTGIFGPTLCAIATVNMLAYGMPRSLADVTHHTYIATLVCVFVLLFIWLLEGKLEGKLEPPYSGITGVFAAYLCIRFFINNIHSYYGHAHWNVIGRLQPINEVGLLVGWIVVVFLAASPKKPTNIFDQCIEF